jgi:hypothetical protein
MTVSITPTDIILLPVLIGYTIWWTYDLRRGTRVQRWTLGLHIVVYGLAAFYIWAVSLGEIVLSGDTSSSLTWVWTIVLTLVGVVAAEAGIWYGEHRMVVERAVSGGWHYRGPVLIAVFWLALYAARFSLEDGLLGGYSVFLPPGPGPPAGVTLGTFIGVVLVVASLYLVSWGFLLGISLAVWGHHRHMLDLVAKVPAVRSEGTAPPGCPPPVAAPSPTAPVTTSFPWAAAPEAGTGLGGGPSPSAPMAVASRAPTLPAPVLVAPEGISGNRCLNCGMSWEGNATFCGGCGQPLPMPRQGS